jgi:hypothetical protein
MKYTIRVLLVLTLAITGSIFPLYSCGGGGVGKDSLAWIGPGEFFSWDTDGTWVVWSGRKSAAIWYDGPTDFVEISALLGPDTVLLPYQFDFAGKYLAFSAVGRSMAHIYYYDTGSGDLVRAASTKIPDQFLASPPRSMWTASTVLIPSTDRRGPGYQAEPRINDGVIAWHINDDSFSSDEEIWVFDIISGTKSRLTDNFEDDKLVNVNKGIVVLERFPTTGGDADIFAIDLTSGNETRLTDNDKVERYISFEDGSIVWLDGNLIYGLELASAGNSPSIIRSTGSLAVDDLWLDGDLLVWRETDILSGGMIWYADLSSGVQNALPVQLTDSTVNDISPRVGGGVIAWSNDADGDQEIYAFDTSAVQSTVVRVTDNDFPDNDFEVGNGIIWWRADYDGAGEKLLSYDVKAALYTTLVSGDRQEVPGFLPPVTWSQISRDLQVRAQRLDGGEARAISSPSLDLQDQVVVQGQIAAWTALDGNDREIYYYDLSASASTVVRVTDNDWLDDSIWLEEGILSWRSYDGNDGEIFACDLSSPTPTPVQITDNIWEDERPRVKNGLVVWEGDPDATESEIYYYDFNKSAPSVVRLTNNTGFDGLPETDGTLIAWVGENPLDGNLEVFSFDISAGPTSIVQVTDDSYRDWVPVVDNGTIAWEKTVTNIRGDVSSYTYIYDTTAMSPVETMLYLDGFNSSFSYREQGPRFESGVLVWMAYQWDLDGTEILSADLNTGMEVFRLSNNVSMDWYPRLGGRTAVWRQDYWLNINAF